MEMELKEVIKEFNKSWNEIKEMIDQQKDEIRVHGEVLETIINKLNG